MAGKVEQVYQGGRACLDTSTGLVAKAFASTTLIPIGVYTENQLTVSGQNVDITLDREGVARWYVNSTSTDAITAARVLKDGYLGDGQTVAKASATKTRSGAGRGWKVGSVQGGLV